MCVWSYEEKNRIKASKIYQVSLQMEKRYRDYHRISSDAKALIGSRSTTFPMSEAVAKIIAKEKIIRP